MISRATGRWQRLQHLLMAASKQAQGAVFALRYGKICDKSHLISNSCANSEIIAMTTDDKTRTELEAAVFRRLVEHLRSRTDVQNIELMNLAGFCRTCLSNWPKEAAPAGAPQPRAACRDEEERRELSRSAIRSPDGAKAESGTLTCTIPDCAS